MYPQWATPERRACLVELFLRSEGFCVHGHGIACPYLLSHGYEFFSENVIAEWKGEDREARSYLWKREQRRLHAAPLKKLRRGPFDSIRREAYLASRPTFRVVGIGVNAFTQRRVAKVEIPEFGKVVWVDISGLGLSKNKLRKLSRNPKGKIPQEVYNRIAKAVGR